MMKKLILLFITFCSLNMLNGMEEKSLDSSPKKGTFDILPTETADFIMSIALEQLLQEMNNLKTKKEFKNCFEKFFTYLFSVRKMKDSEEYVYILTPKNIKKYINKFAYQVFKLCKGYFILPQCFPEKIKRAYPDIGEILDYKNSLWALIANGTIIGTTSTWPRKQINLSNKEIHNLKGIEFLKGISKCDEFYLSKNKLSTLPKTLGNFTRLDILYLSNNQLSSLPDTLGNLIQLRCLYLSNNQLSSLPNTLGNLIRLRSLDLSNNQLSTLPKTLENLTQLYYLNLPYNPFSKEKKKEIQEKFATKVKKLFL